MKTRTPPVPPVRAPRWPWLLALFMGLGAAIGTARYFVALGGDPSAPPGPAPDGMAWIPPGEFVMGSPEFPDAQPVHRCYVDGFWMDRYEVTNAQFAAFVAATGYRTVAERPPTAEEIPGVRPDLLVPCSLVFLPPAHCRPEECGNCDRWWKVVPGANWKHPRGPGSSIAGKDDHPVVHVAWPDAVAYAEWAGKRLPTEAEWERAARGGLERQPFYWGDTLQPEGKWMANVFQGTFPCENTGADGFKETAPVGSYPSNGFGLFDMSGNVWEWCSDWYLPLYDVGSDLRRRNPLGPPNSHDTHGRGEPKRVLRGGSFLCADTYCARYQAGGRQQGEPKTSQCHTGFRCVLSAAKK